MVIFVVVEDTKKPSFGKANISNCFVRDAEYSAGVLALFY
jgi:hypothetical protein